MSASNASNANAAPKGIQRPSDKMNLTIARLTGASGRKKKVTLTLLEATARALKARAAEQGITLAGYLVRLARRDGVDVPDLAE